MAVISSGVPCGSCGFPKAMQEHHPISGETETICPYCGFSTRTIVVRNKDGSPKKRKDGSEIHRTYKQGGLGAWAFYDEKTDNVVGGFFTESPLLEDFEELVRMAKESQTTLVFFSMIKDGKIKALLNENFLPEDWSSLKNDDPDTKTVFITAAFDSDMPTVEHVVTSDPRLAVFEEYINKMDID